MAAAVTMAIIWVVFYFVIRRNGAGKSGKGPISLNPFVSLELIIFSICFDISVLVWLHKLDLVSVKKKR